MLLWPMSPIGDPIRRRGAISRAPGWLTRLLAGLGRTYSERAMLRSWFVRSQQRTEHLKMSKKEIYVLKITKKGNKNKIFT